MSVMPIRANMLDSVISYIYIAYQLIKWVLYRFFTNGNSDSMTCLVGKTAIVTGGNSGIGYATSIMLASRGCTVIIADVVDVEKSRNSIIEKTKNKNVTGKYLNLSSLTSVREFAAEITREQEKIDILINNAGIGISETICSADGLNTVMQVNVFGAFLLTNLLIRPLKASEDAKIVFTGSSMAFLSNLTMDNMKETFNLEKYEIDIKTGFMIYQNSKLCNILMAQEFAKKLRKYNITVNCADPGLSPTTLYFSANKYFAGMIGVIIRNLRLLHLSSLLLGGGSFESALTSFHLASSEKLKVTGKNFYRCRTFAKPKILQNETFCNAIWKRMEELVKLRPEEKL